MSDKTAANRLEQAILSRQLGAGSIKRIGGSLAAGVSQGQPQKLRQSLQTLKPTPSSTRLEKLTSRLLPAEARARGVELRHSGRTLGATEMRQSPPGEALRAGASRLRSVYMAQAVKARKAGVPESRIKLPPSYDPVEPTAVWALKNTGRPSRAARDLPREVQPHDAVFTAGTVAHEAGERSLARKAFRGVPVVPFSGHLGAEANLREYERIRRSPSAVAEHWASNNYPDGSGMPFANAQYRKLLSQFGGVGGAAPATGGRTAAKFEKRLGRALARAPRGDSSLQEAAATGYDGLPLHPDMEARALADFARNKPRLAHGLDETLALSPEALRAHVSSPEFEEEVRRYFPKYFKTAGVSEIALREAAKKLAPKLPPRHFDGRWLGGHKEWTYKRAESVTDLIPTNELERKRAKRKLREEIWALPHEKEVARLKEEQYRQKKTAARRGVKTIRELLRNKEVSKAERLARKPGVLSPGARTAGSHLEFLGNNQIGGEGAAEMVMHPRHGLTVAKTYSPGANVYSEEIIKRKEQLRDLGPYGPKLRGAATLPAGNTRHFYERVRGHGVDSKEVGATADSKRDYFKALRDVKRRGAAKGFQIEDLRPGNALWQTKNDYRFVDVMPLKPSEVEPPAMRRHIRKTEGRAMLPTTPDAAFKLFHKNRDPRGFPQINKSAPTHVGLSFKPGGPAVTRRLARELPDLPPDARSPVRPLLSATTPPPAPAAAAPSARSLATTAAPPNRQKTSSDETTKAGAEMALALRRALRQNS